MEIAKKVLDGQYMSGRSSGVHEVRDKLYHLTDILSKALINLDATDSTISKQNVSEIKQKILFEFGSIRNVVKEVELEVNVNEKRIGENNRTIFSDFHMIFAHLLKAWYDVDQFRLRVDSYVAQG